MSMIRKTLLLVTLVTSLSFADTHTIEYLDDLHANISETVLDWSTYADLQISGFLGYQEQNKTSTLPSTHPSYLNQSESKKIDSFFQNNKYIEETKNVFIRVRTDTTIQSIESNKVRVKIRAQLPFSRSKKQLKLFVEDMSLNDEKTQSNENGSTNIGFRYEDKKRHGIHSRYAIGFSGLYPFISARYSLTRDINNLEIEPVQTFKYSNKYYFEEETNIYFDKTLKKDTLFRMTLHRGTKKTVEGMDYSLKFEYYTNTKKNKGFHFEQGFYGNTKYRNRKKEYRICHPKHEFSGINNYVTVVSYRANIWRKWFFYEIKPGVNFHRDADYDPNYSLRFFFDFYFGENY